MLLFGNFIYSKIPPPKTAPGSCTDDSLFFFFPTVGVLLINAVAILSEDRFLARSTNLKKPPLNPND